MNKISTKKGSPAGRQGKLRSGAEASTGQENQRVESKRKQIHTMEDSELRYRRLFEAAQDGILILDAQTGVIDDVNPYLIDRLGYSRAEFVEKKLWEVGAFKDVLASKVAFNVLQEKGYIRYDNLPLKAKDGQLVRVEFISNVYLAGDRQVIQCNIRDITDRTQVNDALRASEKLYRSLFENMLNGFAYCKMSFDMDRPVDFTYLEVNSAFESLTGLKDVIGKNVSEVIPGIRETDPELFELYGRVALTGKSERFETYVKALKMWFLISVYSPQREYFVAVFDVITERKQAEAALARSEREYRTLFENMPIGMYRTAADGRILDANEAMVKMFGYPDREALLAENVVDLYLDPASDRKFKSEIEKTGIVSNFEAEFKRPDGTTFWTEDYNRVIRGEDGKPLFYEGSLIDITERKKAEENLRGSEARYKSLFENSPLSLWEEDFSAVKQRLDAFRAAGILDIKEYFISHPEVVTECAALIKVRDVNKAAMKMFGAKQKGDLLKSLKGIITARPDQGFQDELINIADGKTAFDWEGINKTLDGRLINIELSWSIAPGYEDSLSRVVVSMIDITGRKQAEEMRKHLASIIEASDDAIIGKTLDGVITSWNSGAQRLYGYSSEEAIGQPFSLLIPSDRSDELPEILTRLMDGENVEHYETVRLRKDGVPLDVSVTVSPIKDTAGQVVGVSSIGRDITERKQSERRIGRQLEHLAALREIDRVIASSFDMHYNLSWILESVTKELGVDAADILILNAVSSQLQYGGGVGFHNKAPDKSLLRPVQSHAMRAVLDRQLVHIPNLNDQGDYLLSAKVVANEDFVCYYGVPLIAKGSVKGVLEVFHRGPLEPDQDWLDFLNILAGQSALAIDNATLFDNLQRSNIDLTLAYDATIEGWSRAMDLRDKETEGHTLRVTALVLELAGLFGIGDEKLVGIRRGALLHDIGKMGVPDGILLKPGKLTEEEWLIMKKHPALAFEMLSPIRYLQSAIDIPYCHHEKWDGTGYPRGLKGEQIPLAARIFTVIDVWDALTSDRPYRNAWPNEKVLEYLKSEAGTSFDPEVVKICLGARVFERQGRI